MSEHFRKQPSPQPTLRKMMNNLEQQQLQQLQQQHNDDIDTQTNSTNSLQYDVPELKPAPLTAPPPLERSPRSQNLSSIGAFHFFSFF